MKMYKKKNHSQRLHSQNFDMVINDSSKNTVSSSLLTISQPVTQLPLNGCNISNETTEMSSQESIIENIVPNDLSNVSSTHSRTMPLNFCDSSDVINNINKNKCISSNQKAKRQKNHNDVSVLSDVNSIEKSSNCSITKVTLIKEPAMEVVKEKKLRSHKQLKRANKNSKADLDKDFVPISPKLENKVLSLIKKQIVSVNTNSYKNVKSRINHSKYKHLIQYHQKKWDLIRKNNNLLGEPEQVIERDGTDGSSVVPTDYTPEVVDPSNSNTPAETSNNDSLAGTSNNDTPTEKRQKKKVRSMKERKKKRKVKSTKKHKDINSDENGENSNCDTHAETINNVTPGETSYSDSFAETSNNDTAAETSQKKKVRSLKKGKKKRKVTKKHKDVSSKENVPIKNGMKKHEEKDVRNGELTVWIKKYAFGKFFLLRSKEPVEKENLVTSKVGIQDEVTNQNDTLLPGETPQISPIGDSTPNMSNRNSNKSLPGKSSKVKSRRGTLFSTRKRKRPNKIQVLAPKNVRNEEIHDSNETEKLENSLEPLSASDCSDYEKHQNDNQVSCETSERLSDESPSQPTACLEEEIVDDPVANLKKAQELKNKWLASVASYDQREGKRNDAEQYSLAWYETPKRSSSCQRASKQMSWKFNGVEYSYKAPDSSKEGEGSEDANNERNEETCASAVTANGEGDPEPSNNKVPLTLLVEGCNFSQILQKFRQKHYKDKFRVFFPEKDTSNNSQVSPQPDNVTKESPLGDDSEKRSFSGDVSNVQTVTRKKERDKCDEFEEADENSNSLISLQEPVQCLSSLTEKPLERTVLPALAQDEEPLTQTASSPIPTSSILVLNSIQSNNEETLNSDVSCFPVSENFEGISNGFNVRESCVNSPLTGIETTPEKNVNLQEGDHETYDHTYRFRDISNELRLPPENTLPRYNLRPKNVLQSSSVQIKTNRKLQVVFNNCMAQNKSDNKKFGKSNNTRSSNRKRSLNSSANKLVSLRKKMKKFNGKDTNSNQRKSSSQKVFNGDEYIPLDASGPTRFAVAPLDKVKPYPEHAAKDFKGNMLYGSRVKRFSDAKSLETYKLKQKASRKRSSY